MSGERDLEILIRGLSAELVPGTFVFATLAADKVPPDLSPRMRFEEAEGSTLILEKAQAEAHGLPWAFPCRMITLNVHSALEAVGFMARIAAALTEQGISANPVAGFYHDHLFVPEDRAGDALDLLERLARDAA